MSWKFTEDEIPIIINIINILPIIIQWSEDNMKRQIKIHHSDIPSKYLGSTSSINGDSNHRFNLIKGDAQEDVNTLTTHPFNRLQATLYLNSHLNSKLHYLARSNLSTNQVKINHKAHTPSIIYAMGYNKIWPRELKFETHTYVGLELKNYEVEATKKY